MLRILDARDAGHAQLRPVGLEVQRPLARPTGIGDLDRNPAQPWLLRGSGLAVVEHLDRVLERVKWSIGRPVGSRSDLDQDFLEQVGGQVAGPLRRVAPGGARNRHGIRKKSL